MTVTVCFDLCNCIFFLREGETEVKKDEAVDTYSK